MIGRQTEKQTKATEEQGEWQLIVINGKKDDLVRSLIQQNVMTK